MVFSKNYFNNVFKNEGWHYSTSEYERVKYLRQIEAIKQWGPQPGRILEIGCAEGIFTLQLARTFPEAVITGVDFSSLALQKARENCCRSSNLEFLEGDIIDIFRQKKLSSGQFDVVIQSESLYYLFTRLLMKKFLAGYFNQLVGMLNDGGIFLTSNGISGVTKYLLEIYYWILKKDCDLVYSAQYREWNDLRKKHFTYDLKVFLPFQKKGNGR